MAQGYLVRWQFAATTASAISGILLFFVCVDMMNVRPHIGLHGLIAGESHFCAYESRLFVAKDSVYLSCGLAFANTFN